MTRVHLLSPSQARFPPADQALRDPNGLLAIGGDLGTTRLLNAYSQGIFPWFDDDRGPILWWSPDPRAVLFPSELRVTRRLERTLRSGVFSVRLDTAFGRVVNGCAAPRSYASGTWITARMKRAYQRLHRAGYAHSCEVWEGDTLVGGLYGVSLGAMFFGESMFFTRRDASKVALVSLVRQLGEWGFRLLDCQVMNPHLASLGAREISRGEFLGYLAANAERPTRRGPWTLVHWPDPDEQPPDVEASDCNAGRTGQ